MGHRETMAKLKLFSRMPIIVLLFSYLDKQLVVKSWLLDLEILSEPEKVAIDELRELVINSLPQEFMENDSYLAKWLSARDFNVSQAKELLLDNVQWRQEHRLESILEEDFSYMEREFPYERNTVDLEGRPILYFHFGMWNIHKLITEEDSLVTLGRYMTKILEESDRHVRSLRREENGSPNQFSMIINFDGYDIWNQGCFQCLAFYRGFGQTIETHFPRSVERVVLINVPTAFEVVYWYVEAVWLEKTRASVSIFGHDRRVWEPALLTYVNKDHVPGDLLQVSLDILDDSVTTTALRNINSHKNNL